MLQPPRLLCPWDSPGQDTGVGSCSLLQGIFPTQEVNPGLPHCRQILYRLSHKGSQRIMEWVAYPFSRGSSQPRNRTRSPTLQVDSSPTELSGKPKNTGVGSLSLLLGIFPTQESNQGLMHFRHSLPAELPGEPCWGEGVGHAKPPFSSVPATRPVHLPELGMVPRSLHPPTFQGQNDC